MSKIIPIFKYDDETDISNYRPIALLSNFNRIFQKIMYDRMKDFIEKHSLQYSSQYGCDKLTQPNRREGGGGGKTVQTNMDKNLFSCGVFIDLKKPLTL